MSLAAGARLGPYEIVSPLGAGGMGEVYRAHDAKLGRDVAIKILPDVFAADPERRGRFEREAKTLAALNHPHIAQIYGFEESSGIRALVMELVEGPTLADRIAQGPLSIDETVAIARQIADALEAAHDQGIVHRDLKPANIKVRGDGTVKVLDFGLAKALDPAGPASPAAMNSPTLSVHATQLGVILGTAAYMAPEQARGRNADRRADIWAFGVVCFEMLTGNRAFGGEEISDTLASVLKDDPAWAALPPDLPASLRRLLRRCLEKDPRRRLSAIGDARLELDERDEIRGERPAARAAASRVPWIVAIVASLIAIVAVTMLVASALRSAESAAATGRYSLTLPGGQRLAGLGQTAISLSPDGKRLAYIARGGGPDQIYVREIDSFASRPLPGTEDAVNPFFSPDGEWIAFFTADALRTIAVGGGPATTLARVEDYGRGGTWGSDGNIVFASSPNSGLSLVPSGRGPVQNLTKLDGSARETSHRHPHYLPGGALLFTVGTGGSWDDARIEVLKRGTNERTVLIQGGSDARYVSTGHLVFVRAATLIAIPVDLQKLRVTGSQVSLVEGVLPAMHNTGQAQATFSDAGPLIYISGDARGLQRVPVWVDRTGTERALAAPPSTYENPRLSPDGKRLAVSIDAGNVQNIWIQDLFRGTLNKFTPEGAAYALSVWTPDGKRVIFQSPDSLNLFWKNADGSGGEEALHPAKNRQIPESASVDGRILTYTEIDPVTGRDIRWLSLDDRRSTKFLQTAANESTSALSPDGHWIAYQSDRSGRDEIYVQPFPGPGSQELVSTEGGTAAIWSRNGNELFYRNADKMMAVAIATQPAFHVSKPELLFEKPYWSRRFYPNYDVASDGRFVMIKENEQVAGANVMNVVLHWRDELKRRATAP
jgi:serine/threonine-protein kinase